ncbi:MAG: hypothetical protein Q7S27_05410 [Nanoarchaeota archaeon]|nr:hypothetical protein [Nanoarchaeota archaeon]
MQKRIFGLAGFAIAVLLVSSFFVIALETDNGIEETKRNDYNARLGHINCRVDLTNGQIDLLSDVDPNLTMYKEKLDADYAKLKELADAMNHKEFSTYITTTFKENLKNSVMAVNKAKVDFRKSNLTSDEKKTVRDGNKKVIAEYADCINKADKDLSEKRTGHLTAWINKWNNVISKMKEKGHNTTEMELVVMDAQSKLMPILDTIKNASSKEARKTAMENARNLHLHLWARFEIARIESYLMSIEEEAVAKGFQTEVDAINARLDEAGKLAISGKRYKDGEFDTVWSAIKESAKMLKDLNKKLRV